MKSFFTFSIFLFSILFINAQSYNYYFGNLHSHTAFSDGNKDSLTSGIGRPDGSYTYAKASQNFNFLGISEHNHYSSLRNPGFKLPRYQVGLNMANAANQEGTFLSLYGIEFGVSSEYNGHVIIYGFNQLLGWETNVVGQPGNNYDIYNDKSDFDGLFRKIKNNPGSFAYLAHPNFNDFSTNGNYTGSLAYAPYNASYDSAIVGMPLRSGLAFSTFENYNDYSIGNYFVYFKKLLYQGYHLGIGYDHDNHYTNFGRSNGGRLAIITPSLTRNNLISAMQQMHFYGSDDSNAKIEFSMNGNIMGSILSGSVYPTFQVLHNDPDGELADTIKIWKGYKNSGGLWADIVNTSIHSNTSGFVDYSIQPGIEYYYFAEIKQADGQWIVTSPIWYTGTAPVFVKENLQTIDFNFFPNPVLKQLNLIVPKSNQYDAIITDVLGKEVLHKKSNQSETLLLLNEIVSGIYTLTIKTDKTSSSKKIIIE